VLAGARLGPRLRYDAFGNGGDGLFSAFSYVGEFGYYDERYFSALYNLWHRWYDPAAGRFTPRDPIARQGVTAYPYVGNNPMRWVDAEGLAAAFGFMTRWIHDTWAKLYLSDGTYLGATTPDSDWAGAYANAIETIGTGMGFEVLQSCPRGQIPDWRERRSWVKGGTSTKDLGTVHLTGWSVLSDLVPYVGTDIPWVTEWLHKHPGGFVLHTYGRVKWDVWTVPCVCPWR
jgi:RHS repeat-associated protein